jgi:type II secretory pathway pseudopilin PulG
MIYKNNSNKTGFTPLENKRSSILSSLKGFTLVEIIIAGLIISITAGGTFASYLYARQYSDKFRHRAMATAGASEIAEYIRYRLADGYRNDVDLAAGKTYRNTAVINSPGYVPSANEQAPVDAVLDGFLDPGSWDIDDFVDSLDISYTVSDVNFDTAGLVGEEQNGLAADPSRRFKKITVRVAYDNRKAA